ncbi:MAG: hypothetical protein V1804_03400 [Patescibacteria group bacterium]
MPINNLENLVKCPVCGRKYEQAKILVLEEEMNKTTLHVTCENCKISSIVFISSGKMGIVSLGMLTDLQQEEAKNLFKKEAISTDNVIEVHEYFKNYKGETRKFYD